MQGPDTLVATAAYQPEPTAAAAARRLMFASLIYLPIVFLLLVLDKV